MQSKRFGDRFLVRFASGESVRDPLTRMLGEERIGYAAISGIGALSSANIWYWNSATLEYEKHDVDEQVEVVSMLGSATLKDRAPFLHLHVALGRSDLSVIGGHLGDAVVYPNLELWLQPEAEPVSRVLDEACGLYVMDLPKRP